MVIHGLLRGPRSAVPREAHVFGSPGELIFYSSISAGSLLMGC